MRKQEPAQAKQKNLIGSSFEIFRREQKESERKEVKRG